MKGKKQTQTQEKEKVSIGGIVELVELDLVDDNPYQPRQHYSRNKIDEIADSIEKQGLLQKPLARRIDGRVQLAFGHLRKRAFVKLEKKNPTLWGKLPVEIRVLTDEEMFLFALEENLHRADITPIDVAKSVDRYLTNFPKVKEEELAKKLNMTQGNISNMRRVLRLPEKVLAKIEEGVIGFTMGRELLVLVDAPDSEKLMTGVLGNLQIGGKQYGHPCTVEGIVKAIDSAAESHLKSLQKGVGSYYRSSEPLFDMDVAGCGKCEYVIKTHITKSQARKWCVNFDCWDKNQKAHIERTAALAVAKMQEDVMSRIATAEIARAEGKADISQEIPESELSEEEAAAVEEVLEMAEELDPLRNIPENYPCRQCMNVKNCDRASMHLENDGTPICEHQVNKDNMAEVRESAVIPIPPELQNASLEKAGTRAEVLDLNKLRLGGYTANLKAGYEQIDYERIKDPEECQERCTTGFHYSFDSRYPKEEVRGICTNLKCLSKKKSAFTRDQNAVGTAKKRAETKAIKEAVDGTTALTHAHMKVIVMSHLEGSHVTHYGYSNSLNAKEWWYGKLGLKEEKVKNTAKLYTALDEIAEVTLATLVVEFALATLRFEGDLGNYKLGTTQPLSWLGVKIPYSGHKDKQGTKDTDDEE